jgi:hypothetical protein
MQTIYEVEQVGINIHLLTYLSQCVLNVYGLMVLWCLWSYFTFIPEWLNGKLLILKHGSQAIAAQMANNNLLKMAVRYQYLTAIFKLEYDVHWPVGYPS